MLVETRTIELDTSPIDGILQSFPPRTRWDAERACRAVYERTCQKVVFVDDGTTWRFLDFENYFTLEVEMFCDAVVIHDIEITLPRDATLGAFVVWYDGHRHHYRVPIGDGPANFLGDPGHREAACDLALTHLLLSLESRIETKTERRSDLIANICLSTDGSDMVFNNIRRHMSNSPGRHRRVDTKRCADDGMQLFLLSPELAGRPAMMLDPAIMITPMIERYPAARSLPHRSNRAGRSTSPAGHPASASDIDIGTVMAALVYGTAARRIADPTGCARWIGNTMRTFVERTPAAEALLVIPGGERHAPRC